VASPVGSGCVWQARAQPSAWLHLGATRPSLLPSELGVEPFRFRSEINVASPDAEHIPNCSTCRTIRLQPAGSPSGSLFVSLRSAHPAERVGKGCLDAEVREQLSGAGQAPRGHFPAELISRRRTQVASLHHGLPFGITWRNASTGVMMTGSIALRSALQAGSIQTSRSFFWAHSRHRRRRRRRHLVLGFPADVNFHHARLSPQARCQFLLLLG
jgi:hypothetical protein